jgi:S-layer protein
MATTVTADDIQGLYIAYFNRPADFLGLQFWTDAANKAGGINTVANAFAASPEYTAAFAGKSTAQIIDQIYMNLFGRHAEVDGIKFWGSALDNKVLGIGNIAYQIMKGAHDTDGGFADATAVANKVKAATAFYNALDTSAEIIAYSGDAANATVRTWLTGVTDQASLDAATSDAGLTAITSAVVAGNVPVVTPIISALTAGIDTLTGAAGNDVFNASDAAGAAASVLGGLDIIDGGAGQNTANIADSLTGAGAAFTLHGATFKNIQQMNISTSGGFTGLDLSGVTGLTNAALSAQGTAASTGIKLGAGVTATVSAVAADIGVTGGANVTATTTGAALVTLAGTALTNATVKAGTGAVSVSGAVLANVAVTGGDLSGANAIDNGAAKTTLTTVTLTDVDTNANLRGAGLTNLTVGGSTTAARTVTVTNATVGHSLKLTAAGTGYDTSGASPVEHQTVVTDAAATSLTVTTTAASSIDASNSTAVTAVVLNGAGALKFAPMAGNVLSIDGSAATGALTLGTLNAATVTVKTGSGADSLTVSASTAATTVTTGDGNDSVTLGSSLFAGSTINLGAGNDKLLGVNAQAPTTGTGTLIDGGAGTDTLSADLVNAGNAALFKNFENLSLNSAAGLDLALLSGNTITALTMDTASTSVTYQHVTATGLTDSYVGDNSAVNNTLSLNGVSGSSDSFAISFTGVDTSTPVAANVKAGTITAAGIENFTIASGGTKAWNSVVLGADTSASTVTINGAANLDLTFASGFGDATNKTGVSLIDGSTATGALNINTTNVDPAGLVVKTGTGADTITLASSATVLSGAGADTIVTAAGSNTTITGGTGVTTVDAHLTLAASTAAPKITTLTDAKQGDILTFVNHGTEAFTSTKVDVHTATALFGGSVNALDLASTADGATTNSAIKWFQYAGDTYIIEDNTASTTAFGTADVIIKLTGLHDLSTATGGNTNIITLGLGA